MKFGYSLAPCVLHLGNLLFIEPHPQPVRPQSLREGTHRRLVLRAVTEEHVVLKVAHHDRIVIKRTGGGTDFRWAGG